FIFNCLTSISNFINKGDKVAANHYLGTFAKLVRATLNHSRAGTVTLEDELQLLENYLKMEQLRFEDQFDYHIELGEGVEPFEIGIPPMMVQPFVENAIIHGLSKKEEKGEVKLLFQLEEEHLQVSITDNGVGIEQSRRLQKHGQPLHKSVGMTITKKRLELLSGQGQHGRVETEELKDEHGEVLGTRVV
ncbi:MAG: histidine kinase, partial [Bacteroidetes bacterium]|nr:histidine kinase [Bacteroidota bacterium]